MPRGRRGDCAMRGIDRFYRRAYAGKRRKTGKFLLRNQNV